MSGVEHVLGAVGTVTPPKARRSPNNVLAQRLAHAHGMLTDPRRRDEKIAAIVYETGLSDLSYFHRVFRRHYGAAPSDVRRNAREDAPGTPLM